MIRVEKINEVFLRIRSEPGIEQELSQFFTFDVPGAKFMPLFKAKMWDGKARLYDLQRKTLYVGLLQYVHEFARINDYQVECSDALADSDEISLEEVKDYAEWLNLHSRGNKIDIRDYQLDAVQKALSHRRKLLLSPTASGKSLIIYTTMRYLLEQGKKCILIVPTTSLVEQMVSDFADYSSENGWRVDRHCQKLYSGFSKVFESDVLVTTWQSIYKQPKSWFAQFDVVFGDEAHQFKAKSLSTVMENMTDVKYRIGTTGTLDNGKVNKLVLEGVFGPVYKVISTRELMDQGSVANLKIKCLVLKYDEVTRKMCNKNTYQNEMDFLVLHEKRNRFIRNLAISCEGNTLVLFQFVEKHGKVLYDMVKAKVGDGRKVFFISGGTDVDTREEIRKLTDSESNAIILASFGTTSTGVNIPSIQNVIFASPSKSKIRNLQSIGRGLRLRDGKAHCNLFDIADDLHWKGWKNHTLKHLQERVKIYAEEKFVFKIIEVDLEK